HLKLPVFVILPGGQSQARRTLKLGWVTDYDDHAHQFLILFGPDIPPTYSAAPEPDSPFILEDRQTRKASSVLARPGQQRFRFQVIEKYGSKCAVCDMSHPALVQAAHLRGKSERGSDDWRNGIPLCPTHHQAFDNHL